MKKFQFSLQRMLDYKQTLLDREKDVLHSMHAERAAAEGRIAANEAQLLSLDKRLKTDAVQGTTMLQMQMANFTIANTRTLLRQQAEDLSALQQRIDAQTKTVMAMSQEVSGLERLEEKQREEYNYTVQKEEAEIIGEMVSARYVAANA